jgi:hypothetical protein
MKRAELTVQAGQSGQPRWQVKALALVLVIILMAGLLELAASLFYHFAVSSQFEPHRADPAHYYRSSNDPLLAYELVPGFRLERNGRDLAINSLGLRGPEPVTPKGVRIAVLGDSVTFGIAQGERQTIPRLMEGMLRQECGTPVEVVNMGVPGYGVQELNELLRTKAQLIPLDGVIYLLNLNDFARRDTLWEGADAGLYRMYRPPLLKTPFLLQKALYRWKKGGGDDSMAPSIDWYRWLFNGTSRQSFADIESMSAWAKANGVGFTVFILPSGGALSGGSNALKDEHEAIVTALGARKIAVTDDVRAFLAETALFDETDHLTVRGNEVAAALLVGATKSAIPALSAKAECRSSG